MLMTFGPPLSAQTRLSEADANALLVSAPQPVYPPLARQAKIQALVRVDVLVSKAGAVLATTYLSGHPLVAKAVMEAAKLRKYKPYFKDGKALQFVTTVEYGGPSGMPHGAKTLDSISTEYESNIDPPQKEICTGHRAFYPARAGQIDLPMERRQRFEIRECGVGGVAQVLAFESGQNKPSLVYTTNGGWPLQVYHAVNVLVVPLGGTAGGVLVFHFKAGRVQRVSGGHSKHGIAVQLNDDSSELSIRLPHAQGGRKTETLRYPIEY